MSIAATAAAAARHPPAARRGSAAALPHARCMRGIDGRACVNSQAQAASEETAIDSQLLLSAQEASDVDATQDALLQAALAASAAEAGVSFAAWGAASGSNV